LNIDLFITPHGESGLLCDRPFGRVVAGVILDAQTREVTLEFSDMDDTLHLNIPVEEGHVEKMLLSHKVHVGVLENGMIAESLQLPLLYLNDPYGGQVGHGSPVGRPSPSIIGFEQFMKRVTLAQALHREDLGDEGGASSVLHGMDPRALELVPQLVRQRMLEAAPRMSGPGPQQGYSQGLAGPGMKGPGGASIGGTGGNRGAGQIRRAPPPRRNEEEE